MNLIENCLKIYQSLEIWDLKKFCLENDIDIATLRIFLLGNPKLRYELVCLDGNIKEKYDEYLIEYSVLTKSVIREMIELSKDGFKMPFDTYNYYSNNDMNLKRLGEYARECTNFKNKSLILNYIGKFHNIFEGVDSKTLNSLKQSHRISCCKDTIVFTNGDLSKAIEDIEEKHLPHQKGVLYGAIKRQVELRNSKIMEKKIEGV